MMYSWPLLVSMLTMMDLIDGSHSTRTPVGGGELDWRWLWLFSRLGGQTGAGGDAYLEWLVLACCRTVKDHSGDSIHVFEESECPGGTEGLQVLGVAKFDVLLVMTPKLALLDLSPA